MTNPPTHHHNIQSRLQASAESILPGVNLSNLLRNPPPGTRRSGASTDKIATLLLSGSIYFTPAYLSGYFPMTKAQLEYIKTQPNPCRQ